MQGKLWGKMLPPGTGARRAAESVLMPSSGEASRLLRMPDMPCKLLCVGSAPTKMQSNACASTHADGRAVPELRSPQAARTFNVELAKLDYDLEAWRLTRGTRCNLALLDRRDGAGWDLARQLIRRRNSLNRGRLDAGGGLRHRFFRRSI